MKKILLTITAALISFSAISQIDTAGLFAVYNFNLGSEIDGIQPRQNGYLFGGSYGQDRFNNTGAAVRFINNGGFDLGYPTKALVTDGLTISAWIKLDNIAGQKAIVAKWAGVTNSDQYLLMVDGNKLRFAIGRTGYSANGVLGNTTLVANQWYHVAATWNTTGTHAIYVNGALDVSTVLSTFTTINNTSATNLSIGAQIQTASRYFYGSIDEVLLYRRSLSASEIQNIYNAPSTIPDGLISAYTFNNNTKDVQNYNDAIANSVTYTTDRFGNANTALDMSTASYLNLGDYYDIFSTGSTGKKSYSFWVNFKSLSSSYQMLISKSADAGCSVDERQFLLRLNPSNKLEITTYGSLTGGNNISLVGSTTFTTGQWYHVVMNYDASNTTPTANSRYGLYVNAVPEIITAGVQTGTGIGNGIVDGPAKLAIGTYLKSNGVICTNVQRLNAYFDDLYIYNKTLSASEVATLYGALGAVSVKDVKDESTLNLYPNPNNGEFIIDLNENSEVNIINSLGQVVLSEKLNKGKNTLSMDAQTPGIYFAQVKLGAKTKTIKMIKL